MRLNPENSVFLTYIAIFPLCSWSSPPQVHTYRTDSKPEIVFILLLPDSGQIVTDANLNTKLIQAHDIELGNLVCAMQHIHIYLSYYTYQTVQQRCVCCTVVWSILPEVCAMRITSASRELSISACNSVQAILLSNSGHLCVFGQDMNWVINHALLLTNLPLT